MEHLTFGQMADNIKLDEVAILVNENIKDVEDYIKYKSNNKMVVVDAVCFNNENVLVSYKSGQHIHLMYAGSQHAGKYVVLKRSVYENLIKK